MLLHWLEPRHRAIRHSPPFVTRALRGLSHLTVWWMRLGVPH